ncbi:hypothetical protein J4G07_21435 [Candidatus Poribacteria bacterium]|nr:hypothetical protein [Candidatus Poribacteria bacterium]
MQTVPIEAASTLLWRSMQEAAVHRSELTHLLRRGERAWVSLPSALLKTRYQLNAVEQSFGAAETTTAIQAKLRQSHPQNGTEYNQHYLIAQPQADAPCYNINEYVQRCIAGDLAIAERLRGRTVIHLYQTEAAAEDLLNSTGVSRFVKRVLVDYLKTYGKKHLIGFTCEVPKFLSLASVLGTGTTSVPWSSTLLETTEETLTTYLPLVFYETYNSAAVRNTFWGELTTRFATYFLRGVRDFCHQEKLQFALSLPASAKALEFELGAMLAEVDCPILNATEIDTPKRFVIAKWVCSDTQYAGISRKASQKTDKRTVLEEASLGFNLWINSDQATVPKSSTLTQKLSRGYPKRPLLMVAPTQSLWTKPDEKQWNGLTKAWGWLCQSVWELGYDFRIVSEQELRTAEIVGAGLPNPLRSTGKRDNRSGVLSFPNDRADIKDIYNVILLPSCISLQEKTVKRLRAFTKAKGRLIADEPIPYLLNGRIGLEPYPLEQLIYGRRTTILRGPQNEKIERLEKSLRKWVNCPVSVYRKPDNEETNLVQVHHRATEAFEIFYLFNRGTEPIDALIEIDREVSGVTEWDVFKGTEETVDFWHANGRTYLNRPFTVEQGRLFEVF